MEELVALCKRRGFIFQSSEIYGGLQGTYDFGPLGVELKNNIKNAWWDAMVYENDDIEMAKIFKKSLKHYDFNPSSKIGCIGIKNKNSLKSIVLIEKIKNNILIIFFIEKLLI